MDGVAWRSGGMRQAVVSGAGMMALRRELRCDDGAEAVATKAKDLPKETFHRKMQVAVHEKARLLAEDVLPGPDAPARRYERERMMVVSTATQQPASSGSPQGVPLASLKEIFLPQLAVDRRHRGRVLLGTLCVKPFRLTAIFSVLADKSGKAVRLGVYHWLATDCRIDIEARFCAGTKVAIKEPFFKHSADGKYIVRVDNPADLVFDDGGDDPDGQAAEAEADADADAEGAIQELERIRGEGNRLFAQEDWSGAIELYSECIAGCGAVAGGGGESEKVRQCLLLAFSNRSQAWLRKLNFKDALDDANKALEFDPNHQKSISRRDRAWQGLGKAHVPKDRAAVAAIEESPPAELPAADEKDAIPERKLRDPPQPKASRAKLKDSGEIGSAEDQALDEGDSPPDSKPGPPVSAPPKSKGADSKLSKATVAASKVAARDHKSASPPAKSLERKRSKCRDDAPASPAKGKFANGKADAPSSASKGKRPSRDSSRRHAATPEEPASDSDSKGEPSPPGSSNADGTDSEDEDPSGSTSKDGEAVDPPSDPPPPPPPPLSPPRLSKKKLADARSDSSSPPRPSKKTRPSKKSAAETRIDSLRVRSSRRSDSSPPARSPKKKAAEVTSDSSPPPHPRRSSSGKGKDVVILEDARGAQSEEDCEGPAFAAWLEGVRSAGDALLKRGKWADAIRELDRVLGFLPSKRNRDKVTRTLLQARSQRAEAWLCLGNHEAALRDADAALEFAEKHPKSAAGDEGTRLENEVRRGRALHGLAEYERAGAVFAAALGRCPGNASIADFLRKSSACLAQARDGVYDLDDYFLRGCRGPPPFCSDFVGPVEVRRAPGKGRGLFATRGVGAGDLLFVSNPLAVVCRRLGGAGDDDFSMLATKWRRHGSVVGLEDFVRRLAPPQSRRTMYQLRALSAGVAEEDADVPAMAAFVPGAELPLPEASAWALEESAAAQLGRLRAVVTVNAMDGGLNPLNRDGDGGGMGIGCVGLWALPSFMNHSCAPNCHMIDVGNAMFVRASRAILEGEELTRAYFDVYQSGPDRQSLCRDWQFQCGCERCALENRLVAQGLLPVHEYCDLLARAREESLKRAQAAGREGPLSLLLPNPQPAMQQLSRFADWLDRLLGRADGLGSKERAWMGASHLDAYISRFVGSRDEKKFMLALENVLEFMTNTAVLCVGRAENALWRAAQLLDMVEDVYGKGSRTYRRIETRVLDLFATAYGNLSSDVLLTMSGLMASKTVR